MKKKDGKGTQISKEEEGREEAMKGREGATYIVSDVTLCSSLPIVSVDFIVASKYFLALAFPFFRIFYYDIALDICL